MMRQMHEGKSMFDELLYFINLATHVFVCCSISLPFFS